MECYGPAVYQGAAAAADENKFRVGFSFTLRVELRQQIYQSSILIIAVFVNIMKMIRCFIL